MLERMLESHSSILGGPEPHLLTPLAHMGMWDKVEAAPYDPGAVSQALRDLAARTPNGEQDQWDACRAYCDHLYGQLLEGSDKTVCLDKTPAYGLILPFMMKVFPDAKFVVLTRHPLATFSSFANSFFDGEYETAHAFNPLLLRYVPALAAFIRQQEVPFIHVRYEDLVKDPESWMERIYAHIEVPFEADTVNYGKKKSEPRKGLGDPIGVQQHSRPSTKSITKWVQELGADPAKRAFMQEVIDQIDPADLETIGYPVDKLWQPLRDAEGESFETKKEKLTRYRLQRRAIIRFRESAKKPGLLRSTLKGVRGVCEGLLRE
jgi:hypothetical protein